MSLQTVARQFVELCNQGKNFDVMRTMYAPDIVSVEGDGKETAGQGPVIKKSEDWAADNTFHGETVRGPFFNGATRPVRRPLHLRRHPQGHRQAHHPRRGRRLHGQQDDKITREQFFYDGEH